MLLVSSNLLKENETRIVIWLMLLAVLVSLGLHK